LCLAFNVVKKSLCEADRVWQSFEARCYHDWNYTWADCFFLLFFHFSLMKKVRLLLAALVGGAKNQGLRIRLPLAVLVGGDKISISAALGWL